MSATSHVGEHKKTYLFGSVAAVACLLFLGGSTGGPSQASLANSNAGQYCKWVFDRYESSSYEQEWTNLVMNGGVNDNVCEVVSEEHHVGEIVNLMSRLTELVRGRDRQTVWPEQDTAKPGPEHQHDNLLSRFHYRRVCFNEADGAWYKAPGKGVQLIEPLFGMLRDPYDAWCGAEHGLSSIPVTYQNEVAFESTQHLLPQGYAPYAYTLQDDGLIEANQWRPYGRPPWHSYHHPIEIPGERYSYQPPRNLHIDLGAAPFRSGPNSGVWFHEHYHLRGQPFESIIAAPSDDRLKYPDLNLGYENIPEELLGIYNVLGIPVSLENDRTNIVDLIRRTVRPQDNLVLKMHGTSRAFAKAFAHELARWDDDGVSRLVKEFYFEHRVNFAPMARIWGFGGAEDPLEAGSLATSYKLFLDLRNKGIRSHSWP